MALQWCNQNRTKLGRAWSSLEFKLRMQEFINLLNKKNDAVAAMKYAQKNLVKFVQSALNDSSAENDSGTVRARLNRQMDEVIRAMGLIGYPQSQREKSDYYKELTCPNQCKNLSVAFEKEAFELYGLNAYASVTQTL